MRFASRDKVDEPCERPAEASLIVFYRYRHSQYPIINNTPSAGHLKTHQYLSLLNGTLGYAPRGCRSTALERQLCYAK